MIDWIAIRNFAITKAVELELGDRFTAVTGETGSGKSLMVDALSILLGARADNALIQYGKDQAEIQASFNLPKSDPVFNWLDEHDLASDQELQLRRIIRRDKPGRGYINGKPVNISMLRDLGQSLVDIHGQHEHHSLMRRPVQQALLDEAAGSQELLAKVNIEHEKISQLQNQLDQLKNSQQSITERIDLLKFQLSELELLAPIADEWEQLEIAQKRLHHSSELVSGTREVANALAQNDDQSVYLDLNRLSSQLRQLESLDNSLGSIATMLEEAIVNIGEAAQELKEHYEGVDLDPQEAQELELRVSTYHSLARKHRINPAALADHAQKLRQELDNLRNPEAERERLEEDLSQAIDAYTKIAKKLSKKRASVSKTLSKDITSAMQKLGMDGGTFDIAIQPVAKKSFPRSGLESVEFMVTANPGVPPQPLAKIASGGEISRISLAIQVILADAASVPTLVFDEVDVGIGGTVANVVGERLKQLGLSRQVISVTHLAQVAAKADHHLSVTKRSENGKSVHVEINKLTDEERIQEIARMSGSDTLTSQSRAHAEQLLATN